MTISTVSVIMGRIKSAEPESPIAVFRVRKKRGYVLDSVFANTVSARWRISQQPRSVVGVYHRHHHLERVRNELIRAEGIGLT